MDKREKRFLSILSLTLVVLIVVFYWVGWVFIAGAFCGILLTMATFLIIELKSKK